MRGLTRASTVLVLLAASAAIAAPPAGIRLPDPAPAAPVFPGAVSKLTADQWFVIDADSPVLVLASPEGVVSVTEESGPVKLRGKFIDGGGKVESRTFKGKQVFVVEPLTTGRVELLVIPTGATKAADVVRRVIDVDAGQAPQPPPAPKPDDDPKPKPPTPDTLADAAWVVVVLESSQKTPELAKLLDPSGDFRKGLIAKRIGYREYDKDSPDLKSKRYLDYATQAGGLPFVLVLDKTGKVLRPTKATAAELDKITRGQ